MEKTYYELHQDYRRVDAKGTATIDDYVNEYFVVGACIDTKVIAKFDNKEDALQALSKYTCNNPEWYFLSEVIVEVDEDGEEIETNQGDYFFEFAKLYGEEE